MTLGLDLQVDPLLHDLVLANGDLVLTSDLAQAVKIALLLIRGEWFLDINEGVPYFTEIFQRLDGQPKVVNIGHVALLFKEAIAAVSGIIAITDFNVDFNPGTREITIDWSASSVQGDLAGQEVI